MGVLYEDKLWYTTVMHPMKHNDSTPFACDTKIGLGTRW